VAFNLSSGQGKVDSREWVMMERPSGSPGTGMGDKATTSPSKEEEEELQVLEVPFGAGEGSTRNSSPGQIHGHRDGDLQGHPGASGRPARVDRLELSVGPTGSLPPVTPSSPADALAEGALTQVRTSQTSMTRFTVKHGTITYLTVKHFTITFLTVKYFTITYLTVNISLLRTSL
jgi:tau tubulin kinase